MANEILQLVRTAQKTAAAPAPEKKEAAAPAKEPEKNVATPAPEKKEAAAPAAPEKKEAAAPAPEKKDTPAPETKEAGGLNMELTTDVMAKIAALIMSTEEGAKMAEDVMAKAAGAEAAQEAMAFLALQSELAEKQAAFEQGQADAQALIDQQIYMAGVKAAEDKQSKEFFFKLGQAAADASMADLMGGDTGAVGGDPAAGAGATGAPMMGGEGDMGAGDAEGEVTIEDVAAALESLVADGTLQPEEAQQIMAAVAGGGEGGEGGDAGAAAAPADAGAAAAAPAGEGEGAEAEEPKEAAAETAEKAATLLDAIRQLQKR